MGKRGAGTELNSDNWKEQHNTKAGDAHASFPKAPKDVLQARRIVRAKRPEVPTATTTASASTTATTTSTNPFANVALVTKNEATLPSPTATATAAAASTKETTTSTSPKEKEASSEKKEETKDAVEKKDETSSEKKNAEKTSPVFGNTFGFKGFASPAPKDATTGFAWGSKTTTTSTTGTTTGMFNFGTTAANTTSSLFAKATDSPQKEETPTAPQVILPSSYTVQSGEENEQCLLQVKSKSFLFDWNTPSTTETPVFQKDSAAPTTETKVWKDTGVGSMRVLLSTTDTGTHSIRLVQRQESTHHVLMNVVVKSCRRRPDSNIFEINGTRAVKMNAANATKFQHHMDFYFGEEEAKEETKQDAGVQEEQK